MYVCTSLNNILLAGEYTAVEAPSGVFFDGSMNSNWLDLTHFLAGTRCCVVLCNHFIFVVFL